MNGVDYSDKTSSTKPKRTVKMLGGAELGKDCSAAAKRLAAAVLEVLAGARTPAQAAEALSLSVPRYYQVETRALQGLLAACESRPKGRQPNSDGEVNTLRQENQRLQREVSRQQALVRAAQRSVGLAPPAPTPKSKSGKKTRKRRVARALTVAARLQKDSSKEGSKDTSAPSPAPRPQGSLGPLGTSEAV